MCYNCTVKKSPLTRMNTENFRWQNGGTLLAKWRHTFVTKMTMTWHKGCVILVSSKSGLGWRRGDVNILAQTRKWIGRLLPFTCKWKSVRILLSKTGRFPKLISEHRRVLEKGPFFCCPNCIMPGNRKALLRKRNLSQAAPFVISRIFKEVSPKLVKL